MKNVNFKYIEPLEAHDCLHCQHLYYDLEKGYVCFKLGEVPFRKHIYQNDCRLWVSIADVDIAQVEKQKTETTTQLSLF